MNKTPNSVAGDSKQRAIISVSELNRRARQLLETHLPLLWVEGEISNFARPSSGHWYFTLKDEKAQVRSAMFRNRNQLVQFRPEEGQQVLVRCRVGLYENRGDYQLIVEHMEPAGLGALQRQFDILKAKLESEGLFAADAKLPLPEMPRHIGIITSPTGAAVRDILHVLERRFPSIPVSIYPTLVQGKAAAEQIVAAIELAHQHDQCDLLILSRGGGSLEDLWPFNEERVARAISTSAIPIICGVGHETDTTIADFVADARAPTPSAAAEMASPDGLELLSLFAGYAHWFTQTMDAAINALNHQLTGLRKRLRHPGERLNQQAQHLDHLEIRQRRAIQSLLSSKQSVLKNLASRHRLQHPEHLLAAMQTRLGDLQRQFHNGMTLQLESKQKSLANKALLLQAISPLSTLNRGYAIAQGAKQQVLSRVVDTAKGEHISVMLADGTLACTVDQINVGANFFSEKKASEKKTAGKKPTRK